MDNFLEILIPLIFAAIYFFGNMFSGKSKEDQEGPPPFSPRQDSGDDDAAERQRRIQEEIRRKIAERRRSSEQPASSRPSGAQLRERRQEVEARRREREVDARRQAREEEVEEPSAYSIPSHERETEPQPPAFSWEEPDNAYGNTIQARLERIEETKRQAEKLQKKALQSSKIDAGKTGSDAPQRTGGYFTGTVRDSLKDPRAARVAFIYGEVLGRPVSLRKEASSVPGLN